MFIADRKKAQIFAGALSVAVNAVLFAAKIWAGIMTGSIALIADAWHTLSDSLTSVFTILAAKLASRKPDKEHPFGHGRWELVAALSIAFILAFIGYEFFTGSIERFRGREAVTYGTAALVITAVSIIIKELMAQYAFYLGRKHNNPVTAADGWHHRSDALSSAVVLVGIIVTRFIDGLWWIDSVLGMICALAIFYAAFKIMRDAVTRVLGEEPEPELAGRLAAEVRELCGHDLELHHLHLHNYISHKELTLHMRLDNSMSIEDGHKISTAVEELILEEFSMTATIHIEPLSLKPPD